MRRPAPARKDDASEPDERTYPNQPSTATALCAHFFSPRSSATYQKLSKHQEAYDDAVQALALVKEKPGSDVTVEAKAQLRKG